MGPEETQNEGKIDRSLINTLRPRQNGRHFAQALQIGRFHDVLRSRDKSVGSPVRPVAGQWVVATRVLIQYKEDFLPV